jgi:hypothetical protein
MFYKFVGGDDAALLDVFDKAVAGGSFKFGAAWDFNDPFEFKFGAIPPSSRQVFEAWHRTQVHPAGTTWTAVAISGDRSGADRWGHSRGPRAGEPDPGGMPAARKTPEPQGRTGDVRSRQLRPRLALGGRQHPGHWGNPVI